jgi:hypothetical protein
MRAQIQLQLARQPTSIQRYIHVMCVPKKMNEFLWSMGEIESNSTTCGTGV